jgi:hypothetical protein
MPVRDPAIRREINRIFQNGSACKPVKGSNGANIGRTFVKPVVTKMLAMARSQEPRGPGARERCAGLHRRGKLFRYASPCGEKLQESRAMALARHLAAHSGNT